MTNDMQQRSGVRIGFPASQPVSPENLLLFENAYANTPVAVSDLAFGTLFGWQEYFHYQVSCINDFLLVYYIRDGQAVVLPPLLLEGNPEEPGFGKRFLELARMLEKDFRERNIRFFFESFPEIYTRHLPQQGFAVIPQRDRFDYIYRREDLCRLEGKQFAAKRNLVRQFERANPSFRYEALDGKNAGRFFDFVRTMPFGTEGLAGGQLHMIERLLAHANLLDLCGGMLLVGDAVVAGTIGSLVSRFAYPDGVFPTVVVHCESARVEYKGAYQMINRLFCSRLPSEVVFINREEDLGIPGLRKAKMSYHPALLLQKSRVTLADGTEGHP